MEKAAINKGKLCNNEERDPKQNRIQQPTGGSVLAGVSRSWTWGEEEHAPMRLRGGCCRWWHAQWLQVLASRAQQWCSMKSLCLAISVTGELGSPPWRPRSVAPLGRAWRVTARPEQNSLERSIKRPEGEKQRAKLLSECVWEREQW